MIPLFPQSGRTEANPSCPPSERPRLRHNGWGLSRTWESTDRPSRRPAPPITARTRSQACLASADHRSHGGTASMCGDTRIVWTTGRTAGGTDLAAYPGKKRTRRVEDRRARERRREISYRTISLRLAGGLCPPTVTVNTTHLGKMMGLSVNSLRTRPPGGKAAQTQGQRPESLVRLVKEHRA